MRSDARVIALNVSQDAIEVHQVRRVLQTGLDGLLEAIQGIERLAKRRRTHHACEKVIHARGR